MYVIKVSNNRFYRVISNPLQFWDSALFGIATLRTRMVQNSKFVKIQTLQFVVFFYMA